MSKKRWIFIIMAALLFLLTACSSDPQVMDGGFEQVGPIGKNIVSDDQQTTTQAGDIVLYSGDQIVVFYGSNSWAYTRLGHVDLSQKEMAGRHGR